MVFVVAGLGALVLYMASKSKAPGVEKDSVQSLGPDLNLPSLGATDKFSPTLTGGSPLIAKDNRTRLSTRFVNTRMRRVPSQIAEPSIGANLGMFGNMPNASNTGGFKREDPQQLTTQPAVFQPRPASVVQRFKF